MSDQRYINCRNCGHQFDAVYEVCPQCGNIVIEPSDPVKEWPEESGEILQGQNRAYYLSQASGRGVGMGWYRFVIYFQLFAAAALYIIQGIGYITGYILTVLYGMQYSDISRAYELYPKLRVVMYVTGVIYLALGAAAIVARHFLAGFKKNGPYFCLGFPLAGLLLGTLLPTVLIGVALEIKDWSSLINPSSIGQVIGVVALIVVNYLYFIHNKKRNALFCN